MPPWKIDELKDLGSITHPNMSVKTVHQLFDLFGGNVRNIFQERQKPVEDLKEDLVAMIRTFDVVKAMESVRTGWTVFDSYIGVLFSLIPEEIPDPSENGHLRRFSCKASRSKSSSYFCN
jgi:hypothetical protein